MKIWCFRKMDTAMKWRELLVVEDPYPLACVAHNIFGKTPVETRFPGGYLCSLKKGLGIHQGSDKLLIHEQDDVSDHFLPTAQVEIVGAGWKMFFEIVGNSTVKTVFYCHCLVRIFCKARDIQTSSAPEEVLVVEV